MGQSASYILAPVRPIPYWDLSVYIWSFANLFNPQFIFFQTSIYFLVASYGLIVAWFVFLEARNITLKGPSKTFQVRLESLRVYSVFAYIDFRSNEYSIL